MQCPKCKFYRSISLLQIAKEETIICHGCLNEIKLIDNNNSVKKSDKNFNNILEDIKKLFK